MAMTTCPQCNAALNASTTVTLYNVDVSGDQIVSYEGGPLFESSEDVVEMFNEYGAVISCVNGHIFEPGK